MRPVPLWCIFSVSLGWLEPVRISCPLRLGVIVNMPASSIPHSRNFLPLVHEMRLFTHEHQIRIVRRGVVGSGIIETIHTGCMRQKPSTFCHTILDLQSQRHQKRAAVFPVAGLQREDDIPPFLNHSSFRTFKFTPISFSILRCFDFQLYANLTFDFYADSTADDYTFDIEKSQESSKKGHKKARPGKREDRGGLRKGRKRSQL